MKVLGGSPRRNFVSSGCASRKTATSRRHERSTIVKDSIFFKNGVCLFPDGCPPRTSNGDGLNVGSNSVVTGNTSNENAGHGISVSGGTVIGNTANRNAGTGLAIGVGSVVAHNAADGNAVGLSIACPSNVIDNTAFNNSSNLLPQGAGCSLVDNVAP